MLFDRFLDLLFYFLVSIGLIASSAYEQENVYLFYCNEDTLYYELTDAEIGALRIELIGDSERLSMFDNLDRVVEQNIVDYFSIVVFQDPLELKTFNIVNRLTSGHIFEFITNNLFQYFRYITFEEFD